MSIERVEALFQDMLSSDKRRAAEVAYVLARLYSEAGDEKKAAKAARQSIKLFESCEMDTLEQCAAHYVTLEGVALPSIIHADVVRDRLRHLGV